MKITPDLVAVGIANADRSTLASLLVLFTDADLPALMSSQIKDLIKKFERNSEQARTNQSAFAEHIAVASKKLDESEATDERLRLQLWMHLRNALDLVPEITFSHIGVQHITRGFGTRVPEVFASQLDEETVRKVSLISKEYWTKHAARRLNPLSTEKLDTLGFDEVVQQIALRTLAGAAERGELPDDVKSELLERVRKAVESLDPEARQRLFSEVGVDMLGDAAALKILLGGGGLAGLGVAVELGGFAAYILAAKASAIIPLVGGKTLVSTLAVLANPWFIIPVLVIGGGALSRATQNSLREAFAPMVVATLALNAISNSYRDAGPLIAIFRELRVHLPQEIIEDWEKGNNQNSEISEEWITKGRQFIGRVGKWSETRIWADPFPDSDSYLDQFERFERHVPMKYDQIVLAAGAQTTQQALDVPIEEPTKAPLAGAVFGDSREKGETFVHAALTLGDLLFDMAAIDPRVIEAADFVRIDDLGDHFSFGLFSKHFQELTGASATGAASQLRGYVAERLVASRLVELGHQVSFPATPNQPGFDLEVDGEHFQVKCGQNLSILEEHFKKYPDTPVLANNELVNLAAEQKSNFLEQVFAVEGFSLDGVEEVMNESIEAGAELLDYEIPLFSAIVIAGQGAAGWWNGELGLSDAMADLGTGLAAKTGLGTAGAIVGKGAGLLFFGPAGAVVFGGVLAVAAAGQSRRLVGVVRDLTNESLAASIHLASQALVDSVVHGIETKIQILEAKRVQVDGRSAEADYVRRRFDDQTNYLREHRAEAQSFDSSGQDAISAALYAIDLARRSQVHLIKLQAPYHALLRTLEDFGSNKKRWGLPFARAT